MTSRHTIDGRTLSESAIRHADSFQQLSAIEQIRQKPMMWISDIAPSSSSIYCFENLEKIVNVQTDEYIEGVERLFIEILSNSIDNCTYSIHYGRKPDAISVRIGAQKIQIINGGCNLPVEKSSKGVWIPAMLFGELFSSSHYDAVKTRYKQEMGSGGTYGVGSTLVNAFSDKFEVLVEDPVSKRRFTQVWSRGMPLVEGSEPIIEDDQGIVDTKVSVTYTLDWSMFPSLKSCKCYPKILRDLFAFHAVTASFTAKVPVYIYTPECVAGKLFDTRLIDNYAALFVDLNPDLMEKDDEKESSSSSEDEDKDKKVAQKKKVKTIRYYKLSPQRISEGISYETALKKYIEIPTIELILFDNVGGKSQDSSIGQGTFQLSFVNGIITPQHGIHFDEIIRVFFGSIMREAGVNLPAARRHVNMLLSIRIPDPKFKGQCKSCLTGPKPDVGEPTESIVKELRTWDTVKRIRSIVEAAKILQLKKTDGKKVRRLIDIPELDDANNAGTLKSKDCTIVIGEGTSAAPYLRIMRDTIPNGRDNYGIYLMRGKPLNTMNASAVQLTLNRVYCNIKRTIGLKEGVDYSSAERFRTLRYGRALVAADADYDGWHILGLVICMFWSRFPSLMSRGFLCFLRTPMLRVLGTNSRGETISKTFYTKQAYESWKTEALNEGGRMAVMAKRKPQYYKGLGSSSKANVKEDCSSGRGELLLLLDEQGPESISLAFDDERADDRKKWLSKREITGDFLDCDKSQTVTTFVNTGLKYFSLDNLARAIPSVIDGMKNSMRKSLAAGIEEFGLASGAIKAARLKQGAGTGTLHLPRAETPRSKVFEIVASATKHFCYHHGEQILGDVMCNMCRDHMGTNNIPWFTPVSSFGTIEDDSRPAARYASLAPAWWWSLVYNSDDIAMTPRVVDEDKECEPLYYLPVAAWVLCNGGDGVATGFSTKFPSFNIEHVVIAHLCILNGMPLPHLKPWFRGFNGKVSMMPNKKCKKILKFMSHPEEDAEGIQDLDESAEVCVIEGSYTVKADGTIIVTSLPLRTISWFRTMLNTLLVRESKKKIKGEDDDGDEKEEKDYDEIESRPRIVKDYRNLTIDEDIRFEIELKKDSNGDLPKYDLVKLLRLKRVISMANIVLLDEDGVPKKFSGAADIIKYFHKFRLELYEKRRQLVIKNMKVKVIKLEYIAAVTKTLANGTVQCAGRKVEDIITDLKTHLPEVPVEDIFDDLKLKGITMEETEKCLKQAAEMRKQLEDLENTTASGLWQKELLAFLEVYRAVYGKSQLAEAYNW